MLAQTGANPKPLKATFTHLQFALGKHNHSCLRLGHAFDKESFQTDSSAELLQSEEDGSDAFKSFFFNSVASHERPCSYKLHHTLVKARSLNGHGRLRVNMQKKKRFSQNPAQLEEIGRCLWMWVQASVEPDRASISAYTASVSCLYCPSAATLTCCSCRTSADTPTPTHILHHHPLPHSAPLQMVRPGLHSGCH